MFGHGKTGVEMPADAGDAAGGGALRYAGFWARVAALIVDNAIVTISSLALIIGASFAGNPAALVAMAVCFFVALLYWPVMECSARQATFGKRLLGIQVTDMEGGRLSFVRSLLRNLAKIVSSIPLCIGFLLAGFTARKQALHDMIVSCLVVRSGPSHLFKAVAASVFGLIVTFSGMVYYMSNVYLPQQKSMVGAPMQQDMDRATKGTQQSAPAAKPPAPVPQVAVVTPEAPPATAPAPAPAPKPAAAPAPREAAPASKAVTSAPDKPAAAPAAARAAPAKPAAVEVKPAPARLAAPDSAAPPWRVATPKYNDVMTAVMYRDAAGITQLLDLGWWVDRPDTNNVSPLMAAAWNGDAAIVQLLLERGADPNRRARGGSALEYAGRSGDGMVIELLRAAGAR